MVSKLNSSLYVSTATDCLCVFV